MSDETTTTDTCAHCGASLTAETPALRVASPGRNGPPTFTHYCRACFERNVSNIAPLVTRRAVTEQTPHWGLVDGQSIGSIGDQWIADELADIPAVRAFTWDEAVALARAIGERQSGWIEWRVVEIKLAHYCTRGLALFGLQPTPYFHVVVRYYASRPHEAALKAERECVNRDDFLAWEQQVKETLGSTTTTAR